MEPLDNFVILWTCTNVSVWTSNMKGFVEGECNIWKDTVWTFQKTWLVESEIKKITKARIELQSSFYSERVQLIRLSEKKSCQICPQILLTHGPTRENSSTGKCHKAIPTGLGIHAGCALYPWKLMTKPTQKPLLPSLCLALRLVLTGTLSWAFDKLGVFSLVQHSLK